MLDSEGISPDSGYIFKYNRLDWIPITSKRRDAIDLEHRSRTFPDIITEQGRKGGYLSERSLAASVASSSFMLAEPA